MNTKEKHPFISVMILCYNYGHLLGKALDACAAQTFRDFEVVMINNGSTDNTEDVYQVFCRENPDIKTRYVHIDLNQGPSHGINEGLRCAQGEYVMFCDADDWMEQDCLEKLAQKALETDADRVMGQYQEIFPDGTIVRIRKFTKKNHCIQIPMLQGGIFRRSTILKNNLFFPETEEYYVVFDIWFFYNFCTVEKSRAFVNSTIYNYYLNPSSMIIQGLKWDAEKKYKIYFRPAIFLSTCAINNTSNQLLINEIMYWTTKVHYFGVILNAYRFLPRDDAKKLYCRLHREMLEVLPNYSKNPLIWWPFGNGDELIGGLACVVLVLIEKMHMQWLLPLISCAANYKSGMRRGPEYYPKKAQKMMD